VFSAGVSPRETALLPSRMKKGRKVNVSMSLPFSVAFSLLLPVLIGFFVHRDRKRGKSLPDIMIDHALLFVLWVVTLLQTIKQSGAVQDVRTIEQYAFLGILFSVVIPLTVYALVLFKRDWPKMQDVTQYKYRFLYPIRHVLGLLLLIVMGGALYAFYRIYLILF
jgi:hypothetical protein